MKIFLYIPYRYIHNEISFYFTEQTEVIDEQDEMTRLYQTAYRQGNKNI